MKNGREFKFLCSMKRDENEFIEEENFNMCANRKKETSHSTECKNPCANYSKCLIIVLY